MQYSELVDFIELRMRMSHIYQPLLIRSLVDAGGSATVRQLAQVFCVQDESELIRYEKTIKKMPVPVLRRRGVVQSDGDLIALTVKRLSYEQKAEVRRLCEQRMQQFMQQRGLRLWDYRLMDDPVPTSLRYQILKASGRRCALCGATASEERLDVDHIDPRSRGGPTVPENLQVLCAKCNSAKSNKDSTDWRPDPRAADTDPACPFCNEGVQRRAVERLSSVLAIRDKHPVTKGHLLVMPCRHTPDFFTMTERERADANDLLRLLRNRIGGEDRTVTGFNVGVNAGESAGQTIAHAHIHLIPRRDADTPRPKGGVRGVIPEKMAY